MAAHQAGGDVDAYCNKCKFVLAHVILAMNGAKIMKVECKTCRGVHAYRAEPGKRAASGKTAASRTSKTARPAKMSEAGAALEYENVIKGHDLSAAQRYRISVNFAENDVVDHTTFGLGLVTRVMADNKVEVIFRQGRKILAHDRPQA